MEQKQSQSLFAAALNHLVGQSEQIRIEGLLVITKNAPSNEKMISVSDFMFKRRDILLMPSQLTRQSIKQYYIGIFRKQFKFLCI